MATANVYIDGFNFYYRCVRGTPFKWLDFSRLAAGLLPKDTTINRIKYFTARVASLPHDPEAVNRQLIFWRALQTIPNLEIILGHFLTHEVTMPLARPTPGGSKFARVLKTEEKGSDVNLACHLLMDAVNKACDLALVITTDSDLLMPIRMAKQQGLPIILAKPEEPPCRVLVAEANGIRKIRKGLLEASQFPPTLTDRFGAFTKPPGW